MRSIRPSSKQDPAISRASLIRRRQRLGLPEWIVGHQDASCLRIRRDVMLRLAQFASEGFRSKRLEGHAGTRCASLKQDRPATHKVADLLEMRTPPGWAACMVWSRGQDLNL